MIHEAQRALLTASSGESTGLAAAYERYISELLDSPLWSMEYPDGARVPWRSATKAANHPACCAPFRSPGLYIFGSAGIPLYLGMTTGPLWSRLRRRYVCGARSQCQLAADYEEELRENGMEGFPADVRGWYRRGHGGSSVRLKGAVAFAQNGIEGIWFSLLPVSEPDRVRLIEARVIPVANEWNRSNRYPDLLNCQDVS